MTSGVTGGDKLNKQLGKMSDAVRKRVGVEVTAGAFAIQNRAITSLQRGAKTGRVYDKGNGITHQASAPGEPPASDTGNLARRIDVELSADRLSASIGVHNLLFTPYARRLEFGGTDSRGIEIKPRPYMGPAYDAEIKQIRINISKAADKGIEP